MFSFYEHLEDNFLIGGYRYSKDQLSWIFTNQLYNVRCIDNFFEPKRNGNQNNFTTPQYIIIYRIGKFDNVHMYECLGVQQMSQQQMNQLKYPNPHGSYINYKLGYESTLPVIDIQKLLKDQVPLHDKQPTKFDFSPVIVKGAQIIQYLAPDNVLPKHIKKLHIGTLFSGIGAFEEALKQLNINHNIKFACDTGEIELIPLENKIDRTKFKELSKKVRNLDSAEKLLYNKYKKQIAVKIEDIRTNCMAIHNKSERTKYINYVYQKYEGNKRNYVKESYLANYDIDPENFHTDIRFLDGTDYAGQVDILVGGSPCQSFSTYGKKLGLEDTRGTLFYDYARIIHEVSPKVFIYENVAAIKTHDHGHTWETMYSVWDSLGYKLFDNILNATDYNQPQLRRRLFLIGIREDLLFKKYEFPAKLKLTTKSTDFLEKNPIPLKYYLGQGGFEWITTYEKHKRRSRVNQDIIGCETANQQDNWIGDFRVEHPLPEHYADQRIYIGKFDFGHGLEDAVGRKLTPRECLRLMGFSDNFKIAVDDHQIYRQAGNSIVIPVLKELIKSLLPYLQ